MARLGLVRHASLRPRPRARGASFRPAAQLLDARRALRGAARDPRRAPARRPPPGGAAGRDLHARALAWSARGDLVRIPAGHRGAGGATEDARPVRGRGAVRGGRGDRRDARALGGRVARARATAPRPAGGHRAGHAPGGRAGTGPAIAAVALTPVHETGRALAGTTRSADVSSDVRRHRATVPVAMERGIDPELMRRVRAGEY